MNQYRPCTAAIGALLLAVFFLGPLSAPPAHAQDARPTAPPPGKALLYIFRSDLEARDALVPVSVNAEEAGYLENGTFIAVVVNPGKAFVRSGDRVLSSFSFEAAANRSHFVRIQAVHGLTLVQTDINLVGEAEGRNALAQSRFIELAQPAPSAPPRAAASELPPMGAAASASQAEPGASGEPAVGSSSSYIRLGVGYSKSTATDIGDVCGNTTCTTAGKLKDIGSGFLAEGAAGSRFGQQARGEIALGLRYYPMEVSDAASVKYKAEVVSLSVMANAYYDFAASGFTPYIGAGVGFSYNSVDNLVLTAPNGTTTTVTQSGTSSGVAAALMAGLAIPLSGRTVLDIGYRYSMLGKLNFDSDGVVNGKLNAHELTVGFRF